jgi:polyribonucleotide nucleotidyltransferase
MVAGVAMGLILDTASAGGDGQPMILTDILGSEDALGDMDFKVAGTEDAITAFQMDIKVEGITVDVMAKALEQAKAGRKHILQEMKLCDPPPRGSLSSYAPKIVRLKIDQDKIGLVVGSGGKTIRSIIEDSGVDNVEISPEGVVSILGLDADAIDAAKERIMALVTVPEVGTVYRNCTVQGVAPFGCFVEIAPGKQGLVHVRELSTTRIENVEDHFKVGDVLDVKLIEINERGQLRLSHRAILLENEKGTSPKPGAPASSPGPGGVSEPVRAAVRPVPKGVWQRPGPSTGAGNGSGGAQGSSSPPLQKPVSTSPTSEPAKKV